MNNDEKRNENTWDPLKNYERINNIINQWPNWKKEAHNNMFAISTHAKKVPLN